jgi:DNA-binding NtrC family response regulator
MATILVVEDEPIIREVVCDILKASHACHAVRTAEEGLELLAQGAFDVAVCDVKLPGMDGREFLRRALGMSPSLRVIVISGGYGYDEVTYAEEGAFGYLLKPFRAEELEALAERALGRETR